jgi:hypothetical protein
VNHVFVGADDHVWLTHSVLGGMAEFNCTSWVLHESPYQMDAMVADFQGNIWVRTSQFGLFKWNGSGWQNWPTVGGTITITSLGKDRDGVICVSTWYGGVYKMINNNPVFFVNADNIPRDVIARPNGDIWINNYGGNGTLGTVRHYSASGQLLRRMNTFNSGLPDYFVDRITYDSSGNMWFATGEAGLSRMLGSNGAPDAATHWRNWGAITTTYPSLTHGRKRADVFHLRRRWWHLLDGRQRHWPMGHRHRDFHRFLELAEFKPSRRWNRSDRQTTGHGLGRQRRFWCVLAERQRLDSRDAQPGRL